MTTEVAIRDYQKGDFENIQVLWEKTELGGVVRGDTAETVERSIAGGGKLLVMEHIPTQQIIGTSWMTNDGRRIHLHHFGIKPEFQGNKLAHPLMEESIRYVKNQQLQVKIEVHRSNTTAIALYKKYGFEYLGDYDVYIMREI